MNETGLFYRDTTRNTYFSKGEACASGKRSNEIITVALCASTTGEKVQPVVVENSMKPRCFKSMTYEQLPVPYYANQNARMTAALTGDWLRWFDRKMKGRNLLLFMNNAPADPHISLKNVKIQFLPPNTTIVSQPIHQGIDQYRKTSTPACNKRNGQISNEEKNVKDVNVVQAITWIARSWKKVESSTIEKCCSRCTFRSADLNVTMFYNYLFCLYISSMYLF